MRYNALWNNQKTCECVCVCVLHKLDIQKIFHLSIKCITCLIIRVKGINLDEEINYTLVSFYDVYDRMFYMNLDFQQVTFNLPHNSNLI